MKKPDCSFSMSQSSQRIFLWNFTLVFSMLRFEWLIPVYIIIVILESLILNLFLKNFKTSFYSMLISNLISSLCFFPLSFDNFTSGLSYTSIMSSGNQMIIGGTSYYSSWIMPIIWAYHLMLPISAGISYDLVQFGEFYLYSFLLTVLIEYFVIKRVLTLNLKTNPQFETIKANKLLLVTILLNIISYSMIILFLVAIGLYLASVSATLNPFDVLESLFIYSREDTFSHPLLNVLQSISFFAGNVYTIPLLIPELILAILGLYEIRAPIIFLMLLFINVGVFYYLYITQQKPLLEKESQAKEVMKAIK